MAPGKQDRDLFDTMPHLSKNQIGGTVRRILDYWKPQPLFTTSNQLQLDRRKFDGFTLYRDPTFVIYSHPQNYMWISDNNVW